MVAKSNKMLRKKYQTQSVTSELIKKDKKKIIYFYTNHIINTLKKKIIFKNNPCNKIKFNRIDNNFYWLADHNDIYDNKYPKLYDNSANITENLYNFSDFKEFFILLNLTLLVI